MGALSDEELPNSDLTGSPSSRNQVLIVLRGNSGSGKSSIAKELRERYGKGLVIIGQDVVRRTMLDEKDRPDSDNIHLIEAVVRFALERGRDVVLEGILYARNYEQVLYRLWADFSPNCYYYYLDVSLEETLIRHHRRPQASEFGEPELRDWYRTRDVLSFTAERIIEGSSSLHRSADRICEESQLLRREL